ncbi:hypothetical protein SAMN05421823_102434 [Catalinimonas alkaloidigena]|uniref:Uncharacterized protein n=1 Tax=Catalinimonas alkaloidigena TaxID=1075417 RepID=A0A1G9AWZ6_9BACT|nr:hypothetical protein [Catalinimonas alkaloidigena]SDK31851.1 hypothetical protein SAMN05421823_102434 [Catalinimonas alkaloidigena]
MQETIVFYAAAYQQLASISAVLGGLAFTAAAALLATGAGMNAPNALNPPAKITIVTAVVSAVGLIVAALMWSLMAADLSRLAIRPDETAAARITNLNWLPSLAMLLGAVLFFASIGASGWIASRKLGWVTSVAGGLGVVAVVLMILLFSN